MSSTSKKEIQISKIRSQDIPHTAKVYADVFAGHPWFEVSRCNMCGHFGSHSVAENIPCPHCSGGFFNTPAYPSDETQNYIAEELQRFDALGLLAVEMSLAKLTGFAWGYAMEGTELAQEKYSLPEMQNTVQELLQHLGIFYYVSEVGVLDSYQGNGIGKKLTHALMDHGKQSQGPLVLRTNEDSSMRYIAEHAGMIPVMGLRSGVRDEENEARVLFVSTR